MLFYAIRHKPSGLFLPEHHNGNTHMEPTANVIPRLFKQQRHAKTALTAWLAGKFRWVSHTSSYESFYKDDVELIIDHVPHRKAEDMEIVEVLLSIRSLSCPQ